MIKRRVSYENGSFIEFKDTDKDIAEEYALNTGGKCARIEETVTTESFQQEQDGGIFTTETRSIVTENVIDESGFLIKSLWEKLKEWWPF